MAHLDDLGEGPGFRKVRKGLGVTAFGVNAIVIRRASRPASTTTTSRRSCTSSIAATIEMEFGDGSVQRCARAAMARVDAATVRRSATSATSTPSTCARAARTATSGATGACAEGEEQRAALHDSGSRRPRTRARLRSARKPGPPAALDARLTIPLAEITLRASRSSGPGGQHANVTASRVEASLRRARPRRRSARRSARACSRAPARGSWRSPRTSARRRATASSRCAPRRAPRRARSPCRARGRDTAFRRSAHAAPRAKAPRRRSQALAPPAAPRR